MASQDLLIVRQYLQMMLSAPSTVCSLAPLVFAGARQRWFFE
jgi:hypothetical protein